MKDWRPDLDAHVAKWSGKLKSEGRAWWPKYVYHFTDIRNATSVLNTNVLYSRTRAESLGLMKNDNANPEIIAGTKEEYLDLVRLYFRPRTPTQYVNEGIQPPHTRGNGHCPVPVFFLFDLVEIISRDDARFSRGTLASYIGHSERRDYFVNDIPWVDVYSDSPMPMSRTEPVNDNGTLYGIN